MSVSCLDGIMNTAWWGIGIECRHHHLQVNRLIAIHRNIRYKTEISDIKRQRLSSQSSIISLGFFGILETRFRCEYVPKGFSVDSLHYQRSS
jgi:hypothetical protein